MHQQAILTTNHPTLGGVGTPVSIAALEQLFMDSVAANNGVGYKCADPHCGVRVKAVITVLAKLTRKNSPASYFAAKGTSHVKGCTRMPKPSSVSTPLPTTGAGAANPNRSARPVIWIDPRKLATSTGGTPTVTSGGGAGVSSGGRGKSHSGGGTSRGRSQMVESYAIEWLTMTSYEKQSESFDASWNPGGTYFSAFHPIWFYKTTDVTTLGEKIFVGKFKSAMKVKTGYTITLAEKNSSGEELWIWVQSTAFTIGTAGQALEKLLIACVQTPSNYVGKQVFALERFTKQSSSSHNWASLPVVHPHMMWIE